MTTYDASWAAAEEAKRRWMAENGMFREEDEHSSCGVGLVVALNGQPSRKVVENGINALKAVWQVPTPGEVEVRRAKNNEILTDNSYARPGALIYVVPDSDRVQRKYSQKQILHIANFSQNGITGMSQISLYKENAGIALAQQNYVGQFYDGGIVPPGLLSIDGRLGDNLENYTRAVQEQWSKLGREGKVAVLEEGTQYKQLSMSMADAETISSREFQGREFCGFLGVPPHMVGIPVSTSYNSLEAENEGFKGRCILPLGERIVKSLTNSLLTDEEKSSGLRILFDYDYLLRADAKSRATYYRKMLETGMTPNSIMKRENLPPIEGGDQSYVPANLIPIGQADTEEI